MFKIKLPEEIRMKCLIHTVYTFYVHTIRHLKVSCSRVCFVFLQGTIFKRIYPESLCNCIIMLRRFREKQLL